MFDMRCLKKKKKKKNKWRKEVKLKLVSFIFHILSRESITEIVKNAFYFN